MNREEAIKIFQLMKKILSIPNSDAARTIEAIDMAIEALSAEAADVYKAHEEEHLEIINRIKELQYAIAKTQTIVGKVVESADAVCEDTQTEERARFVATETELAHIEAKLENAEKRLQGACTANFVAEQLDRLRNMTNEERWDFFIKFFSPSAEAVEVKAEQLPPKVPTEWINDGMVLVPQHDWIEMQKELEGYVSAEAEWIPCSERLPREDGVYLIQKNWMCYGVPDMDVYYWAEGWNCFRGSDGTVNREHEMEDIIAWMPLPKPYREDGE